MKISIGQWNAIIRAKIQVPRKIEVNWRSSSTGSHNWSDQANETHGAHDTWVQRADQAITLTKNKHTPEPMQAVSGRSWGGCSTWQCQPGSPATRGHTLARGESTAGQDCVSVLHWALENTLQTCTVQLNNCWSLQKCSFAVYLQNCWNTRTVDCRTK